MSQQEPRAFFSFSGGSNCHLGLPVWASSAYTRPATPEVYSTPSTISGVACMPRLVPVWNSQAKPRRAALSRLIVCRGE